MLGLNTWLLLSHKAQCFVKHYLICGVINIAIFMYLSSFQRTSYITQFPVLEKVNKISSETMLLLWSMKEKHDIDSRFKPYFDSLPETFNTGLIFGIKAIMALEGTLLLEERVQEKEICDGGY